MRRLMLIAGREVGAYAGVPSFWVALAMGPILMLLTGLAAGPLQKAPAAPAAGVAAIESFEPALAGALPAAALAEVCAAHAQAVQPARPAAATPEAAARLARFAVMMLLWMNLVGALGMLLQAIVRERSNRALESLLSSARPSEIIFGKLVGVGALSVFVLAAWLGAGALIAASPLAAGAGQGAAGALIKAFADPLALVQAAAVYVLAFSMYGSAMIGLGAVARDTPSAQNLSRPVFGVLLLVFFVSLAQLAGAGEGLTALALVPPFTPFILLMAEPGQVGAVELAVGLAGMAATTAACAWAAGRVLQGRRILPARRRAAA